MVEESFSLHLDRKQRDRQKLGMRHIQSSVPARRHILGNTCICMIPLWGTLYPEQNSLDSWLRMD